MRVLLAAAAASLFAATALTPPALAQAAPSAAKIVPDAAAPKGKLPDTVVPSAYRLDFTIVPEADTFSGHGEIDVTLKQGQRSIYLDGRDLTVTRAVARVGGKTVPATWTQVDPTGVARLDFASPLPAGKATLVFDYSAPFGDSAAGMFHVKVADQWYAWTQFESIDARAAYPSFDEPGFKQPFTVSVTTKPGLTVITNTRETGVTKVAGGMEKHSFETTKPLPTYLVAIDTGPFVHQTGLIPPTPERAQPLPYGAVATQAQKDKMALVMENTPRIVSLLEKYFGEPFPFPKLDQIGTPIMPGAMENAGADTYGDGIIFLDPHATTGDKQAFGMVVAHELSHQWFGDLVSPAWWSDIWLNESFANWMGYRIGNEWRPDLHIGVGTIDEGFRAMDTDALKVGRPIHQPIETNGQIDSAFDTITYGKGGQVVAMIAAYLGDEKFKQGVRLHLKRHAYGNATSDEFFQSIADAAKDPKVLAAFKSFVDQPGVPVVDVTRRGGKLQLTQSRYSFLGTQLAPEQWTVPFCVRVGTEKQCTLLGDKSATLTAPASGVVMPNVGGTGYYRFNLAPADWQALIAQSASLAPGEAIATTDSLWAAFRAGKAPASWLFDEAKAMAGNADSSASLDPGERIGGLRLRGLIGPQSEAAYRKLMASIYVPRLTALGFDPARGVYANEDPDKQKLRQEVVDLVADDADDAATRAKLVAAANKYLAGDTAALDPAYLGTAFAVDANEGGLDMAKKLVDVGLSSEDASVRGAALSGAAASNDPEVARYLLDLTDPRLRPFDRMRLIGGIVRRPATRDIATDWLLGNYAKLVAGGGGVFVTGALPGAFSMQCGAAAADKIDSAVGAEVRKADVGVLDYERALERVRDCGVLDQAKHADIASALAAAAS
ncbi:MAG: M1 family metallopeptidase [Sphingomonas sp.]